MRRDMPRMILPVLAGLMLASLALTAPRAQQPTPAKLFFIPASAGYGISECFAAGSHCGRIVADAYCESRGRGKAIAFGRADDITAAIPAEEKKKRAIETDSLVVSCAE